MRKKLCFTLNGKESIIEVEENARLLDVLRDELYLTGTKKGCEIGECGACTVLVDHEAVCSCMTMAMSMEGHEVLTIEGVKNGEDLHPLQKAFLDHAALQCGFCTPGFIMSALALLYKNPHPTREEIKTAISGNLCRCTGYEQILDAIEDAADRMAECIE